MRHSHDGAAYRQPLPACSTFESSATRLLRQSHPTHSEHARGWLARFSCLRTSPVADSKVGLAWVACSRHCLLPSSQTTRYC